MRRSRLIGGVAVTLALLSVSAWLFAAEARGTLPRGTYEASRVPDWPVTTGHADAIRRDAFARAAVWLSLPGPLRPSTSSGRPELVDGSTLLTVDPELAERAERRGTRPAFAGLPTDRPPYVGRVPRSGPAVAEPRAASPVTCRFLTGAASGTTPKFDCVLDGGEIIKVKYGRNPEIHGEAAATRLLTELGLAADHVRIVPALRCYGCPRFPFLATQLLAMARVPGLLAPNGYENRYSDFTWVAVEQRFGAPAIETAGTEGWAWFELKASQAPRADLDAFRLLAVFLAHWDNKSANQRLVCLDEVPAAPDQRCAHPLLMMQDLGATFGPTKVNLAAWRDLPVWADRRSCIASMRALPYNGATFPDVRISDAGRIQLARQLSLLSIDAVRSLFTDARFPEYQSGTDDERDLQAWMAAFRHRVDQIVTGGPCPTSTGHGDTEARRKDQ